MRLAILTQAIVLFFVVVFFCQKIQRKGYQFSSKYKLDNLCLQVWQARKNS